MSDFPLLNKGKTTDRCAPAEFLHANVPEACPACPTAADLESHFRAYADHYKLHSYIKYDTAITRIERDYTENKWNLHVRGPNGSSVMSEAQMVAALFPWTKLWLPMAFRTKLSCPHALASRITRELLCTARRLNTGKPAPEEYESWPCSKRDQQRRGIEDVPE